jgi:integrase/recombinase XerD
MPPRKRPPVNSIVRPAALNTPSQYLDPFLKYQETEIGMARNTVLAYGSDLRQFFSWFDDHSPVGLNAIDLKALTDYLNHLHERNLSPSTVARHLVAIKMFFRYLLLEGVIRESIADLLNSPKLWQHLPHVLSPDMVNHLLAAPVSSDRYMLRDRAMLALLYATGCRASEVANLKLRDVNLADSYCRCMGKGNKERLVSLNPITCHAVEMYLHHERPLLTSRCNPEELLVSRSGRGLTRIMVWNLVKKYSRRIGASAKVSPHTLRHSFATHMLAGGAEIRALQELLGHASIATTQIYTHVEHTRLKAVHRDCHPRG